MAEHTPTAEEEAVEQIAIVGMAGRFPGASTVAGFWTNLCRGVESIRSFSEAELRAAGADAADPDFVNAGAVMDDYDAFDAAFFGMSRREAELTDPQHRVFLESSWAAVEHAGYDPATFPGRVGIFGGVAANTYFRSNLMTQPDLLARTGDYPLLLATEREYAITRTAYKLGLTGPAVSVHTACSTSAVAVHLAIGSLLSGESDMALAGGARIRVPATAGYVYHEDGILSPDGRCRPFDAGARGTVAASGVAIVVLKRLSDAKRDGDTVYAVIRGSAVNNDGAAKVGYTAPSIDGQAAVIEEALAVAEVDPATIGMVEAHGTATALGDPIEVAALARVYQRHTDRRQYCAIGSLKANVGHLDAAAGVAGIIKAALSLHHEQIPPSINFESPNPQIDLGGSPFFVNTELRPWKRDGQPRRAAVSSFGLGGTNAHVVLEEAPLLHHRPAAVDRAPQVLVLSAKSAPALERQTLQLADHLQSEGDGDLADVAWTLGAGRSRMPHRRAVVANDPAEAAVLLRGGDRRAVSDRESGNDDPGVAFLFPGQGAQHPGMGSGLYRTEPAFKAALDRCAEILRPILERDLVELIYPQGDEEVAAALELGEAAIAQPATFAIQYALAQMWISWGVRPTVLVGHSLGEFAAACLSGVFSLEDALRLVATRGRLMQDLGGGGMLAVLSDPESVAPLLGDQTSIAAINAPSQVVASGPVASVDALEERLGAAGIEARRLPIELAAHSPMMEPMVEPLRSMVAGMHRGRLAIPVISTATGDWLTEDQASDPEYWGEHARVTVRFSSAVRRLLERPDVVLLEVGPGQTLASLVRQHPEATTDHAILSSLPHVLQDVDDRSFARRTLGGLWAAGVKVDWSAVLPGSRRRVSLPTYPFERERHWVERALGQQGEPGLEPPSQSSDRPRAIQEQGERVPADDVAPAPVVSRQETIAQGLAAIISELSGVDSSALDPTASFIDLGFDSLFLTQANSRFRKQFGVRITFRQLFEEAPSIEALAAFIDARLDPEALPDATQAAGTVAMPAAGAAPAVASDGTAPGITSRLEQLMSEQLRLVEQQLELLRGTASSPRSSPAAIPAVETPPESPSVVGPADMTPLTSSPMSHYLATRGQGHGTAVDHHSVSDQQRAAIDDLVRRSDARTPGSKQRAQRWRARLADNRTIVGFDQAWKELVYQVVSARSAGSRIWDVDGNEYIDTALGYGTNLFGHSPDFVVAAIREQLERGYEVGIQNHLLGEVTEMACAMTGSARMAYTTSGGEAVETAIRAARTVTGRDKVAYFTDDIHGRSDIVLGRAVELRGELRTVPMVAGVPQNVVDDALVLGYGTDRAMDAIRAHASELALVLVEPVRTRNPDLQPRAFLRELRRLADERGFLLVFDEIVTGFRAHSGGVQALFDVRADLTTYGKVLGGGLPIGVVAGESQYVDVIDGGPWSFGDDSFPEADITASGGTFIKHPLTLAASRAVLSHLKERGAPLQAELNARTAAAVAEINGTYERQGLPIHIEHFSSFFRPSFTASTRFAGLFQYYLREQGVHTNPPSPSFLSTAHSEADVEAIVAAYVEAGRAMDRDGLLEAARPPGTTSTAIEGPAVAEPASPGAVATPIPVLPNVARFLVERDTPDPNHWNLGVLLRPRRPLDPDTTRAVVQSLLERHPALRLRFFPVGTGWASSIAPTSEPLPISSVDLASLSADAQRASLEQHANEMQESLDLEHGPLFRVVLFDLGEREQRLLVIVHHFAMDAFSWRPFWEDFESVYRQLDRGERVDLPPPSTSFEDWAHALQRHADSDGLRSEVPAWLGLPWDRVRPIPVDRDSEGGGNTNASARHVALDFTVDETRAMLEQTPDIIHKTDLLMTTLAEVVAEWTDSDTALFDMMGHGRDEDSFDDVDLFGTVGFFISYTPMVLSIPSRRVPPTTVSDQIQPILRRGLSFDLLRYVTSDASVRQAFSALPRAQILFNHLGKRDGIDAAPRGSMFSPAHESIGRTHSPDGIRYYPLAISSEIWKGQLQLRFVYSDNLHDRSTIAALADRFRQRLVSKVGWSRIPLAK